MIYLSIAICITVVIGYHLWRRWLLGVRLNRVVDRNRSTPMSERRLIYDLLRLGFSPSELWHDLYVPKSDGNYSQVDAVAMTSCGIIVFEVKNYSGKVYGDEYSFSWKQYSRGHRKPRTFYSPVRQNDGHVRALRKILSAYGSIHYFSVIVFYGDCRLKFKGDFPDNTFVIRPKHLRRVLREIQNYGLEADYRDIESIVTIRKKPT